MLIRLIGRAIERNDKYLGIMPEQPKIDDLVKLMKEAGYSPEKIIDILGSIIKTQIMMGGTLQDKINYYKDCIVNENQTLDDLSWIDYYNTNGHW